MVLDADAWVGAGREAQGDPSRLLRLQRFPPRLGRDTLNTDAGSKQPDRGGASAGVCTEYRYSELRRRSDTCGIKMGKWNPWGRQSPSKVVGDDVYDSSLAG